VRLKIQSREVIIYDGVCSAIDNACG
jgi:hypothetical protein